MSAHRYPDGSVSYVLTDFFLGLGLIREGQRMVWRRLRTVNGDFPSLATDDRRVVYPSEVQRFIILPTCEEIQGRLGYRDLPRMDAEHDLIAAFHGIEWDSLNP